MSNTPTLETLVQRLRGLYAVGKGDPPEFGFRQFDVAPIQLEAANRIEELERELTAERAERKRLEEWKTALKNEAVNCWVLNKENESNPRKMLHDIIKWRIEVYCDPAVSDSPAARAIAAERAAREKAEAEVAQCREDAERYKCVKELIHWHPKFYDVWTGNKAGRFDLMWPSDESDLDASIDAERKSR